MTRRRDERGVAAIVVVVLGAVLVLVAVAAGVMGRLLVEQRRVAAAADLSALAGAVALQHRGRACEAAASAARANGAELVRCDVEGQRVRVAATLPAVTLLGREVAVSAEAQAGPR